MTCLSHSDGCEGSLSTTGHSWHTSFTSHTLHLLMAACLRSREPPQQTVNNAPIDITSTHALIMAAQILQNITWKHWQIQVNYKSIANRFVSVSCWVNRWLLDCRGLSIAHWLTAGGSTHMLSMFLVRMAYTTVLKWGGRWELLRSINISANLFVVLSWSLLKMNTRKPQENIISTDLSGWEYWRCRLF